MEELSLFGGPQQPNRPKVKRGGCSQNPIIFHDYESYVAKFQANEKTTDDTYTPPDVYDAVLNYVKSIYDMTDKVVLRPFYPGGDYEHAEYPENGVVVDNPPFSLYSKICKFYSMHKIPFFIFGPGMTIFNCTDYCTAVVIGCDIRFENGANVRCNFATNLLGDTMVTTACELTKAIKACPSQPQKVGLNNYAYPDELISVSYFQTIARGDADVQIRRSEGRLMKSVENAGKLFGNRILVGKSLGQIIKKAKAMTNEIETKRRAEQKETTAIHISLSAREQRISDELEKSYKKRTHTINDE